MKIRMEATTKEEKQTYPDPVEFDADPSGGAVVYTQGNVPHFRQWGAIPNAVCLLDHTNTRLKLIMQELSAKQAAGDVVNLLMQQNDQAARIGRQVAAGNGGIVRP